MNPKLHSVLKLLQPLGFILFALYFLLAGEVQELNFGFELALAVTSIGILLFAIFSSLFYLFKHTG